MGTLVNMHSATPRALSEFAAKLGLTLESPTTVTGAAIDSRSVTAGCAWFAFSGQVAHAMNHLSDALSRNPAVIVTDAAGAALARDCAVPVLTVPDTRVIAGPAIAWLYGDPARDMTMVGVTGTNGKTSVTHFLLDAWNSGKPARDAALIGTLGVKTVRHPALEQATGFTTPEADALQGLFSSMRAAGVTHVAMEVSSHALKQHRVDGTEYEVAVFTNLTQDHLDIHGDMESYFETKAQLFTTGFTRSAVICVDDEWGQRLANRVAGINISLTTYGTGDAHWQVTSCGRESFVLKHGGVELTLRLPAPSQFNALNVTAAAAALNATGVPVADLPDMLEALRPVPGRMENVSGSGNGKPKVIVDYAHSPDSVARVVAAARSDSGRLIVVIGAGGDRDQTKRRAMGKAVDAANIVFVTDDNPRSEDPAEIRATIISGIEGPRVYECADRSEAIAQAVHAATASDIVVILGKGAETGQQYGTEIRPFDDRDVAAAALAVWRDK
jgi:UDP-N-acetylmuramoyl-L-alanyl-D-glutamate--2,6-diaminopimelate ligase